LENTNGLTFYNKLAKLRDAHTIELVDKDGVVETVTAETVVLAMGSRPTYPIEIPNVKELAITSDDLFSLPHAPGKTLVVGASYVALECAGFLTGLGYDVTVMVRSILLRGFDQEMANRIGDFMQLHGTKFIRGTVPYDLQA
jgi:thioredoxin reductase (NADPH)